MKNIRTDLAVEAHEYYVGDGVNTPKGVETDIKTFKNIKRTLVKITDDNAQRLLQKQIGSYITIEFGKLQFMEDKTKEDIVEILQQEISELLKKKKVDEKGNVLVVGLGNHNITPDAIGPLVVSKLDVTRHLFDYMPKDISSKMRSVSALEPGVLGTTGIETQEIIKAVAEKTKPVAIIAIDALASRSMARLGNTIQIADTGIKPGSGVGNRRKGIDFESLGIPVIALGVPTVTDAATVADDVVAAVLSRLRLTQVDDEKRYGFVKSSMENKAAEMMVTPKEIDIIVNDVSNIISKGINYALQG